MEIVKVCHICLVPNVKMYNLQAHPLNTYFQSVTGNNLLTIVNSPPHACYECAALVKKCYFFKQKCIRSRSVLYGLIDKNRKIDALKLRRIDRKHLGLCSNITYSPPGNDPNSEILINEELEVESVVSNPMVKVIDSAIIVEEEEEPVIKNIRSNEKTDDVKVEENNSLSPEYLSTEYLSPEYLSPEYLSPEYLSSENDEDMPLSKLKDWEEVISNNDNDEEYEYEDISLPEVKKPTKIVSIVVRKKRKKRKTLIDDLLDDVTVTVLTQQEQLEEFNKRKESSNYLNSAYKCELCYKGFLDTDTFKLHMRKHSPNWGALECPLCKFRFKSKKNMSKHLTSHGNKYACNYCPHVSSNANQAKDHLGQHKGVKYVCKQCGDVFTVRSTYLGHLRIKHPSKFICNICGYSFLNERGLCLHKYLKHQDVSDDGEEIPENSIYCEQCDISFVSKAAYKRHTVLSIKHTRNENDCLNCGETFDNELELKTHRRKEHPHKPRSTTRAKASLMPSKCEHCPTEFKNGIERWAHYRRIHPEKKYPTQNNYVCDVCGKRFKCNAVLIYHRRKHTGTKPYKCNKCDKAYFQRYNLLCHELTHSDARPFVCELCQKSFKFNHALKKHMITHTGERPYQCEICSKSFTTVYGRKIHVNTVHFRQPESLVPRKRKKKIKNIDNESQS